MADILANLTDREWFELSTALSLAVALIYLWYMEGL